MSAHTAGPWSIVGQVVKGGADSIAHVTQMMGDSGDRMRANAALIAAAPNLLETLRVARERIQDDRDMLFEGVVAGDGDSLDDIPEPDDRAEVEKYDALLRVIDADIAKATQP